MNQRAGAGADSRVRRVKAGPGITLSCLLAAVVLGILAVVVAAFAVAAGAALIGAALVYFGFRRVTGGLATVEELANRGGVTPAEMERLIAEKQLRPSAIINGRAMYDARALKGAARAIRGAAGPVVDVDVIQPDHSAESANDEPVIDVTDSTSHPPSG